MDSLSQFVLGAGVSAAAMGRRTAFWKSALWGGAAATLPDLDVFIDYGDAVRNVTLHRSWTHSLFYLTLLAPVLAWLAARLDRGDPHAPFRRWWLALWLALFTHPLLDTLTIYGTQILYPFSAHPHAIGSIFIIDPLYTLPLLLGLIATAIDRRPAQRWRWNIAGVVLSSGYLVWGLAAQANVANRARASLHAQGIAAAISPRLIVTPTPFNTLLWRVVAAESDGEAYFEGFYSLLDPRTPMRFERFERNIGLARALQDIPAAQRIATFSHGWFRVDEQADGSASVADLRMGQEPNYAFRFRIAQRASPEWRAVPPEQVGSRGDSRRGLSWVQERIFDPEVAPLAQGDRP